jgi:hypothetical protein
LKLYFFFAMVLWIAGDQTYMAATIALAVTGLAIVTFAMLASAKVCASMASKVLGLVGIPL